MVWLFVAAGVLAALVGLLAAPIHLSVRLEREACWGGRVMVRWLFVQFSRDLAGPRPGPGPRKPSRTRPSRFRWKTVRTVLRVPGLLPWAGRFLVRLYRAVRLDRLSVSLRIGLGDPADTGRLFGLLAPAVLWCGRWPRLDVGLEPDFALGAVTGRAEGVLRLYPARVIGSALLLLASTTAFRFARAAFGSQWKR